MIREDNSVVMLCKLTPLVLNVNEYNTEYTSHNLKVTRQKSKVISPNLCFTC